ncbi:hypothetical protein UR09_01785 [Candidatus Nitromaritima sp. SCGC AAA799-A02]|nr:hypothetical protein UR09_01785 [Candidatus Nitromaritima sp. SCGC AAA799-A02]
MKLKNETFWFAAILCIVLFGFGLRMRNINQPIVEIMEARQTQTAEISRNLIADSFNIFLPRVNRYGPDNPYVVLEFPLFNLIAALSARITGLPLEPVGRFWSGVFGILGCWIWYLFLKRHYPLRAIVPGMIFYLFTFIGIITGRSFQPDTLSLFWFLWVLLELDACYSKNNFESARWRLGILTALACLTKAPMAVLLVVPLAALLWRLYQSGDIGPGKAVSFLMICFVPILLWTVHGSLIHARFPNYMTSNYGLENWFKPGLFFSTENFNYYFNFWLQFRYSFLTSRSAALDWIVGLILLASVVELLRNAGKRKFFLPIVISLGTYYFLFNFHTATHFYYHLPLLPVLTAGLTHLAAKLPPVSFFGMLSVVVTASLINIHTAGNYMQEDESQIQLIDCANIVREVVPQGGLLLTSYQDQSGLEYYSNRVGWIFIMEREYHKKHFKIAHDTSSFTTDHIEAMQEFKKLGAGYYANCDPGSLQRYPRFSSYMFKNFKTVYSDPQKLFIFKLNSR